MNEKAKADVKKFLARLGLISAEIILLVIIFCAALFGFVAIAKTIFENNKTEFDASVFDFLARHVSNVNTTIMECFTFLGAHKFLIPANILLVIFYILKKHKWYSIKIPAIALSSLLLMLTLKLIFHRQRPMSPLLTGAQGFSFPSGHALMSTTFYGLIIFIIYKNVKNKFWKWALITLLGLMVICIGVSRVYLRVHYASDVLAGFCVGFVWLFFSLFMLSKLEKYSLRKVDPIVETGNARPA